MYELVHTHTVETGHTHTLSLAHTHTGVCWNRQLAGLCVSRKLFHFVPRGQGLCPGWPEELTNQICGSEM